MAKSLMALQQGAIAMNVEFRGFDGDCRLQKILPTCCSSRVSAAKCNLFLAIVCAVGFATPCVTATKVWIAASADGGNWSRPQSWSPPGVPQNGDDLIFDLMAEEPFPAQTMHNDLVGLQIRRLEFCSQGWSLDGNELTVLQYAGQAGSPTNTCSISSFTFHCPLRLGGAARLYIGIGTLIVRAGIDLNGNDLSIHSGEKMILSGQIIGTGNITATLAGFFGDSSITFDGPVGNTFSGRLAVTHVDFYDPGQIVFDKQSGVAVNDGLLIGNRAACRLARPHQIGDNAEVCITGGSRLLLDGHTETIGSLCLTNRAGDTEATLVDTGGSTLSVLGGIVAVNDSLLVVPTIRGKLGLPAATVTGSSRGTQPSSPLTK